ncbi:MAG: class I SAM-dependent methyltransferase [candidate division Zixibacteria bacterium]|nr:class I SAM-dependent methyltransferase [candidate division Zixibacteria bacterium]
MLRPNQDAFGRQLDDFFKGRGGGCEIVERDDGFITTGCGPPLYLAPYKKWSQSIKKAIRFVRGRVLDIGCGAGRVALHLQEKGHDVTGIDNSPLSIKICKKRGLKKARAMSITQMGDLPGKFDTIVMFGNNFGLVGSFQRAKRLLKLMYKKTSDNARIIAETADPYRTDIPEHLAYHRRNRSRGRMSGQLRIRIRFNKATTPWFDYLIVSRDELEKIIEGTGWYVNRYIDGPSPSYIMILEKTPGKKP